MSEIKVGDKIKVTKLMFSDKAYGIIKGETYEVIELSSCGDGVSVNTPTRNNVGLIYEQIEKVEDFKIGDRVEVTIDNPHTSNMIKGEVYTISDIQGDMVSLNVSGGNITSTKYLKKIEEEEQVSEFKVGDKVRVKWVDEQDKCRYISKGDCFEVRRVDYDGDVRVDLPKGGSGCLFKHQVELVEDEGKVELVEDEGKVELVEDEGKVGEFKVGDKVKVISLHSPKDRRYLRVGKTYTVDRVDNDGWPLIITDGVLHNMMPSQVEKVEDKTEFTFPEMAQKLIDGEFEKGTELVTNNGSTYFVDRVLCKHTYGLKSSKNGGLVISQISASDFNATWKVKEQSIKEMSIEETQKELGYKIKVTE